jgi:hypothetical protein
MKALIIAVGLIALSGCASKPQITTAQREAAQRKLDSICHLSMESVKEALAYDDCLRAHSELLHVAASTPSDFKPEPVVGLSLEEAERAWAIGDYNRAVSRLPLGWQPGPQF